MVGLDSALLMNPKVWEASGHVGGFSDPMVDDRETRARYRADQLAVFALEFVGGDGTRERYDEVLFAAPGEIGKSDPAELFEPHRKRIAALQKSKGGKEARPVAVPGALQDEALRAKVLAPGASAPGTLTAPRAFNLMFKTHVGALEDNSSVTYLRPETAQGIFVNFKNVCDTARVRVPFGIGQVGKAFRNEINPRNFTFRSREFEQMEIEFFCRAERRGAVVSSTGASGAIAGISTSASSRRTCICASTRPDELAHYAAGCADVEYDFPFGRSELEGIANRTDFDLRQHMQMSGKDLRYFDDQEPNEEARRYSAARHRALGRRRSRHAGVPLRRLQRGRGRRRDAHGAEAPSAARADQGRRVPARQEGRHAGEGARDLSRAEAALQRLLRREGRDRPTLSSAGRGRARRSASPSTATR